MTQNKIIAESMVKYYTMKIARAYLTRQIVSSDAAFTTAEKAKIRGKQIVQKDRVLIEN